MRAPAAVLLACCLFALAGVALIPYAGIETDEALFADPFYQPLPEDLRIRVFHHDVPLMVMSYIGTLKTLLYWPVLRVFTPSPFSLRIPVVLVGVLTILLFYRFAEAVADARAALFASLVLAADPMFLLADTFDWGPVALEHLLLATGCLTMARRRPALGCFFFGLALWNKAVFVWALAGLAAGAVVAYWPQLRRVAGDRRTVVRAACAFLAGSLPFLVYNIRHPNVTLESNAHFSFENFHLKLYNLRNTVDGSGLFGFIAREESAANPKAPASPLGRAAVWIRERAGAQRTSLFPYALVLAILAAPLWWRSPGRRAALFAMVFSAVTFLAMAVTRGAGGSVHHEVLLWPMPHLLVGVAAAALRPRWLAHAAGAVLVASNLLVMNQYIVQLERNGADIDFSDALYPLSDALSGQQDQTIYVIDWGMFDSLAFLHQGRLTLNGASAPFMAPEPNESERREIEAMLADPHGLFLTHVRSLEAYPGVGQRLDEAASAAGYAREFTRTIDDSNGRPVFELLRFRHAGER
jgi:4-amino-4-deoxy-L-arabinose transferase-like glycosyltransferase